MVLLDIIGETYYSHLGSLDWFINVFIQLVTFIIAVLIVRGMFSIPKQIKYQKAQIKLLALLAEKQGADQDLINEIVFEADEAFKKDEHFVSVDDVAK